MYLGLICGGSLLRHLVVGLLLLANPALGAEFPAAPCMSDAQPPSWVVEPTVPYMVYRLSRERLHETCSSPKRNVTACAYQVADRPGHWAILIADDISGAEYQCNLDYEKAHLPPNFWFDPTIESPETVAWVEALKAEYAKR